MDILDLSNYVDEDILTIEYFNSFFKPISKSEDVNDYLYDNHGVDLKIVKEYNKSKIWSMFESDDGVFILPRFNKHAIKYILTEED